MDTPDFLVIGAGLAGIAAAADLRQAGASVLLLDKGRALGGRAATRRFDGQPVDHGAQFCTARTERLQRLLDDGARDGWARVWCHGYPIWRDGVIHPRDDGHPRWCFPDGMRVLPERLAAGLDARTGIPVGSVARTADGWEARAADGERFRGRRLILNLPPAQLRTVAGESLPPAMAAQIGTATLAPAWALFGPVEADFGDGWPALELEGHPVLAWAARDHTKRAAGARPTAVLHARGDWSAAQIDQPEAAVRERIAEAGRETLGVRFLPNARLHRWRYAKPETSLGEAFLWDRESGVGVCGDWCAGGRVEGAIASGWALAEAIAGSPTPVR